MPTPKIIPDKTYPNMWRVLWPDGRLSDMANLTRAKDAAACFTETESRRQRARQTPLEACRSRYSGPEAMNHLPAAPGLTAASSHAILPGP